MTMRKQTATPDCRGAESDAVAFHTNALQLFVFIGVHSWLKLLAVASPRRVIACHAVALAEAGG
jgi:hypothetical protein